MKIKTILAVALSVAAVAALAGGLLYFERKGQPALEKAEAVTQKGTGKKAVRVQERAEEIEKLLLEEIEQEKVKKEEARIVALDPGHQSFAIDMSAKEPNGPGSNEMKAKCTSGTTGRYTGIPEYQLTLDISLLLRTELEARGYQVVLTREDNETAISNAERAVMAADSGADIYVRIHANGSENTSVSGALALVPGEDNPYVGGLASDSYRLAEAVLTSYCGGTGFENKGIQINNTMTGINWSRIPVMILEMGFMSNENDDYSMADTNFRTVMVKGIADGIDQYFGI